MINNLLLIDDDYDSLYISKRMFKKVGFANHIITLSNGKQGIEYFEKLAVGTEQMVPELIFSDSNMPVMNGLEFVEEYTCRFADRFPFVKICIVSALVDPDYKAKALTYPSVVEVIEKPIRRPDLDRLKKLEGLRQYFDGTY